MRSLGKITFFMLTIISVFILCCCDQPASKNQLMFSKPIVLQESSDVEFTLYQGTEEERTLFVESFLFGDHSYAVSTWYYVNSQNEDVMIANSTQKWDVSCDTTIMPQVVIPTINSLETEYFCRIEHFSESANSEHFSKTVDSKKIKVTQNVENLGLPVVYIDTEKKEMPTCDYVSPPAGAWGEGLTNCSKPGAQLRIVNKGILEYDSGIYEKGESGCTIKIRGNTSAYGEKKPYKIKLQKKANLLNDGNNNNKVLELSAATNKSSSKSTNLSSRKQPTTQILLIKYLVFQKSFLLYWFAT